ncbi:hypothetical protein [Brevibacillus marinus]|uniref:hypothetical protein n=1 Tax=Brevibacillus marinus TaxID=2496837 RepID=UPI0013E09165|nr:hypothetical protein [Brevibacillus marinus]
MKEHVGFCTRCQQDIYCVGGFLQGIILENGKMLCLACAEIGSDEQTPSSTQQ